MYIIRHLIFQINSNKNFKNFTLVFKSNIEFRKCDKCPCMCMAEFNTKCFEQPPKKKKKKKQQQGQRHITNSPQI